MFLFSSPLLFYCIPAKLKELSLKMKSNLIGYLNTRDIFRKVLSDLVNAWQELFVLSFFAIGTMHKGIKSTRLEDRICYQLLYVEG